MIKNRLSGFFLSPDFRGYSISTETLKCRYRASGEVVFLDGTYKTAIFEEMLTKAHAHGKRGELHSWPLNYGI